PRGRGARRRGRRPRRGAAAPRGRAGSDRGPGGGPAAAGGGVDALRGVGAAAPPHRFDLTGEAPPRRRVPGHAGAQDLERDRPVTPVAGEEDNAHPALADPVEQAIIPEPVRYQVLIVHGTIQRTEPLSVYRPGPATRPPGVPRSL